MIKEFETLAQRILRLVKEWEPKLEGLQSGVITQRRNSQNRTIKQIVGHMIDSASNNTHRIVHLQYRESPLRFPNYASLGNNDRWIAIQNYQEENWGTLVSLWKYANIHIVHVIRNIDPAKLDRQWYYSDDGLISLEKMILDYLPHLELHLGEIEKLLNG
ncbi:MAG: DinB family protein [Bacteroidetes bacterium]|nr:MAG: DinB family protein [Bacteroidota bacterium]